MLLLDLVLAWEDTGASHFSGEVGFWHRLAHEVAN